MVGFFFCTCDAHGSLTCGTRQAIAAIQVTFTTAVVALDIAAAAEKDNTTKSNLELAAKVINAINHELGMYTYAQRMHQRMPAMFG